MAWQIEIKELVRDRYGKIASREASCCDAVLQQATAKGYSDEELLALPEDAVALGLGCGNPVALADLKEGETVLDLGSGAGLDAFLATQQVGEGGKVIGVDMTAQMVEKALENARRGGYTNVEFRLGDIEKLPVDDASVDVIISNCVINLAPDKLAVFKEAHRVLKAGGRILISDLVTEGDLPEDVRSSTAAWASCLAGVLERQAYLDVISQAGFKDVTVVAERPSSRADLDERLAGKITSVQVMAHK